VVALVFLAEAHVAVPVSLGHARVVHHEEVHVEVVGASSLHLVVFCSDELHHFDTAPLTLLGGRHVLREDCVVERVMAPRVVP